MEISRVERTRQPPSTAGRPQAGGARGPDANIRTDAIRRRAWLLLVLSTSVFAGVVIFPWIAGRSDPGSETTQGALSFDGTNRYVEIRDSDAYSLDKTGELTIEAWVQPRSFPPAQIVLAKGRQGAYEWELRFIGDRLNFYMSNPQGVPNYVLATDPGRFKPGVRRHIAAVVRQGQFSRLYIDGKQVAESATFAGLHLNGPAPVTIGIRDGRGPFNGLIDEVRIWNVARTSKEILAAMRTPVAANAAGLGGLWRFNDGAGSRALDSSSRKNHGRLVNKPRWTGQDVMERRQSDRD